MTRYIASEDNLKLMMNLLRNKSKNIQFEAFHVFKVREQTKRSMVKASADQNCQVFVANPKKPAHIERILRRNKDKLVLFLQDFHNDREGEFGPLLG